MPVSPKDLKSQTICWRDHLAVHPAAEAYPLLSEKELKQLAGDIRRNDLRADFVLWRPDDKTHAGEFICADCGEHRGWLSKPTAQWIEHVVTRFGAPEVIIVRKAHTFQEEAPQQNRSHEPQHAHRLIGDLNARR